MDIDEQFSFGKYTGLKLIEVFRGTLNIDLQLIKAYVEFLLNTDARFRYENNFGSAAFECVDEFEVTEHEIKTLIYHETWSSDDGSEVYVKLVETTSNVEDDLRLCLSIGNQRNGREMGGFYSLSEFSRDYKPRFVVGADPGYICWCIENIESFCIPMSELEQLEKLSISFFNGIHVIRKQGGVYEYSPDMRIKKFTFPENIKQANQKKILQLESESTNGDADIPDEGPGAYGYESWDEMSFYEAFEGDSDAWDEYNQ